MKDGLDRRSRAGRGPGSRYPDEANLTYRASDLRGRRLVGARLEGADLRFADLRGADLRGADLFGARLEGADLRGTRLDMGRIVEIAVPADLDLEVVNQIRAYDFVQVMTRFVGPNRASEPLPCPYRDASLAPLLYAWGSATWNGGRGWAPPAVIWTLEEIIAAVLDRLGARHDLARPCPAAGARRPAGASC